MFIYENDSAQNAHLSEHQIDKLNSWYETYRDPKSYERFKHMPDYSTKGNSLHVNSIA